METSLKDLINRSITNIHTLLNSPEISYKNLPHFIRVSARVMRVITCKRASLISFNIIKSYHWNAAFLVSYQ